MHKVCVEALPTRYIAFEQIVLSLSTLLFCSLWKNNNFRQASIKIYNKLAITEIIIGIIIAIISYIHFNVWVYAISLLICSSVISIYLSRMITAFRAAVFQDRDREDYDNNLRLLTSISGLLGFIIAFIYPLPIKLCLALFAFLWCANIGWIYVYQTNKEKFLNL